MKKLLWVRWWFVVFWSLFICVISIIIAGYMDITTFSRSSPLSKWMISMQHFISIFLFLIIFFLILAPFFLYRLFKDGWEKRWKAFIPIYNIRILLWVIGIETKSFSAVARWIIIWIIFLLLQPRYQCACYSYIEFIASVFLFIQCVYCFWFMIFVFYCIFKYKSENKKLNGKNS